MLCSCNLSAGYRNQLRIGILFGIGIELGIGMRAQPDKRIGRNIIIARSKRRRNNAGTVNLLFLINFIFSPGYLYNIALYKGFCQGSARLP